MDKKSFEMVLDEIRKVITCNFLKPLYELRILRPYSLVGTMQTVQSNGF